jgi:predicted GIY-YIG superfamily endonuclease
MPQILLFPDPRPLVERLGREFFRQAPDCPGVYLMRSPADEVLYVGKAKNLRKRLASYRVANPDRLRRRHLRLLSAVARIDFETCVDETSALARESELLRSLRPRFNRAGTWPGPARFLCWRLCEQGFELAVTETAEAGWYSHGPMGSGAFHLRAVLLRLLWCALHPDCGIVGMPHGFFDASRSESVMIPRRQTPSSRFEEAIERLKELLEGSPDTFVAWIRDRTACRTHPFEKSAIEADLESVI